MVISLKVIAPLVIASTLLGCSANNVRIDNKESVARAVSIENDQFEKKLTINGPGFSSSPGNVGYGVVETIFLRAIFLKDGDSIYQVYVRDHLSNGWRFYDSAYDNNGESFRVSQIYREVSRGGSVDEHIGINITKKYIDDHATSGMQFKISGRGGYETFIIPPAYIQGFLWALKSSEAKKAGHVSANSVEPEEKIPATQKSANRTSQKTKSPKKEINTTITANDSQNQCRLSEYRGKVTIQLPDNWKDEKPTNEIKNSICAASNIVSDAKFTLTYHSKTEVTSAEKFADSRTNALKSLLSDSKVGKTERLNIGGRYVYQTVISGSMKDSIERTSFFQAVVDSDEEIYVLTFWADSLNFDDVLQKNIGKIIGGIKFSPLAPRG